MVAFNRYANDTDEEIQCLIDHCEKELGVRCVINNGFLKGGEGAKEIARVVVEELEKKTSRTDGMDGIYTTAIKDGKPVQTIKERIDAVVSKIYHAGTITYTDNALEMLKKIQSDKFYWDFPVCIAKTQYSFSDDPKLYGCPKDFNFTISDIVINRGAHFIVAIAGKMMRMPGLPKEPAALHIDVVDNKIVGLS
jgi:formate--tetrahydrofolate ligase